MPKTSGIDPHHAQKSRCSLKTMCGNAGVAGCSEHQAPEHGRAGAGKGSGSDGPAQLLEISMTDASMSEESLPGSVREVTRCEHPARAVSGVSRAHARSGKTAPADRRVARLEDINLLM
jgi:hypothetical protein